jgi:hypothetical protein
MSGGQPSLDAGQERLAIADEADVFAQRQKVLTDPSEAALQPFGGRIGRPEIKFLLCHADFGTGKVRRAVVTHGVPAMVGMRMGQDHRIDRRRIDAGPSQADQHLAAAGTVELAGAKPVVEQLTILTMKMGG